jgi:hypothetical protein
MATLIKLTYASTGRATLVNMDNTEATYQIQDRNSGKMVTRINLKDETGRFLLVEEEPQEVLRLVQDFLQGNYQETDWVEVPTIPNIEEQLEGVYNARPMGYNRQPQRYDDRPQRRQYNTRY